MLEDRRIWTWKNTRSVTITTSIIVCPWDWFIRYEKYSDYDLWHLELQIGPLFLSCIYNIGNSSAEGWRGKFSLSDCEAWERSKVKPSA